MIKGYIIDMDGTMLDSMELWDNIAILLLQKYGITADKNIKQILDPLSINEALIYLKEKYHFTDSISKMHDDLLNILEFQYLNNVNLKPGVKTFMNQCILQNKKLCLLTANYRNLTVKILSRHNLIKYFDQIITCDDTSLTKQNGDIYKYASQALNLNINECIVIEDALHAIKAAKQANFTVWAVGDQSNINSWSKIKKISDSYYQDIGSMEVL